MHNDYWISYIVLIICLTAVLYAYLGYPLLIYVFAKLYGRTESPAPLADADLPYVSMLIAAYNEESEIERRLLNAMSLDYPSDKYEVVIAADGCTDDTPHLVRQMAARFPGRIRLLNYTENRGKATVLNEAFDMLKGDIVVLSDANTAMREDSLRRLVAWFALPDVGVVCGRLVMTDPATGDNVDSMYWKYETFLKKCESKLGALLGSNGAIYAMRKEHFPGVPHGTIIDDFYIPLAAKRQYGCRIVYESGAVAREETAPSISDEFHRRSRIGAGGFQSIGMLWQLLAPRHGWIAFSFLSHKVIRWLCPFFLIVALATNSVLLDTVFSRIAMTVQLAGYALALLGNCLPAGPKLLRVFRLPTMFVTMNAALLLGFFKWLFQTQSGAWKRTERVGQMSAISLGDREVLA